MIIFPGTRGRSTGNMIIEDGSYFRIGAVGDPPTAPFTDTCCAVPKVRGCSTPVIPWCLLLLLDLTGQRTLTQAWGYPDPAFVASHNLTTFWNVCSFLTVEPGAVVYNDQLLLFYTGVASSGLTAPLNAKYTPSSSPPSPFLRSVASVALLPPVASVLLCPLPLSPRLYTQCSTTVGKVHNHGSDFN